MTSLPPFRRVLTPNSIVLGEPTKSIAAAVPPSVASITCFTASGAALSIVATAPICRACARFCPSMSATITLPSRAGLCATHQLAAGRGGARLGVGKNYLCAGSDAGGRRDLFADRKRQAQPPQSAAL